MTNENGSENNLGCHLYAMPATKSLEDHTYIIPSYQRGFKWGVQETNRLLEEIWSYYLRYMESAIGNTKKSSSVAKFVGTIIRVPAEDTLVAGMLEDKSGGLPECKVLIDGQQRLTVFTLIVLCLLRRAELYWNLLGKKHFLEVHGTETGRLLSNQSTCSRKFIYGTLIKKMSYVLANKETVSSSDDGLIPQLVREGKDRLKGEKKEDFQSVTAELVYGEWLRWKGKEKNKEDVGYEGISKETVRIFSEKNKKEYSFLNSDQFNENFTTVINIIDDFLDQFCSPASENKEKSKCDFLDEIRESQITKNALGKGFEVLFPANTEAFAIEGDDVSEQAMRLATFWDFLGQYVFLAIVDCKSDNELDIFESLNTAGRALSPVETFIPEVHKYFEEKDTDGKGRGGKKAMEETIVPYEFSNIESKDRGSSVAQILESLRMYGEADDADRALPADILTSFAIIFDGTKLESGSRRQREYLKDTFDDCAKYDGKGKRPETTIDFLVYLTMTTEWWRTLDLSPSTQYVDSREFINTFREYFKKRIFVEELERYNLSKEERAEIEILEEQAFLSLIVLYKAGLKLPLSIACRFFIAYRTARDLQTRRDSYKHFLKALRALLAFAVIWLSAHEGTAGIESKFREVLSGNGKLSKEIGFCGLSLFSRLYDKSLIENKSPDSSDLIFILKRHLSEEFNQKFSLSEWKERLKSEKPAHRKVITQFLVLCSWHKTIYEKGKSDRGLRLPSKAEPNDANNFLNIGSWLRYSHFDIEHVLPQKPSKEWKKDFKKLDSANLDRVIQSLGNVTLLPLELNRSLQNAVWEKKRKGLNAIILATEAATGDFLKGLTQKEQNKFKERFDEHKTAEECMKELTEKGIKWDKNFIDRRTDRMAEIIWGNLRDFLDLTDVKNQDEDIVAGGAILSLSTNMISDYQERKKRNSEAEGVTKSKGSS